MNNSFKSLLHSTMARVGIAKHSHEVFARPVERKTPDDGALKGHGTSGGQRHARHWDCRKGRGEFGKHFIATKDSGPRERQVGFTAVRDKEGKLLRTGLAMERYRVLEKLHATKGWRSKTYVSPVFVR